MGNSTKFIVICLCIPDTSHFERYWFMHANTYKSLLFSPVHTMNTHVRYTQGEPLQPKPTTFARSPLSTHSPRTKGELKRGNNELTKEKEASRGEIEKQWAAPFHLAFNVNGSAIIRYTVANCVGNEFSHIGSEDRLMRTIFTSPCIIFSPEFSLKSTWIHYCDVQVHMIHEKSIC